MSSQVNTDTAPCCLQDSATDVKESRRQFHLLCLMGLLLLISVSFTAYWSGPPWEQEEQLYDYYAATPDDSSPIWRFLTCHLIEGDLEAVGATDNIQVLIECPRGPMSLI